MIADLKPYPEYKESGLPWLGQVPGHWEVLTLGRLMAQRKEKNDPIKTTNILSLSLHAGVTLYADKKPGGNKAKEDLSAYMLAYPGDIVLNSMNVVVGSVGLSKYFGAVSPVYYMLYPHRAEDLVKFFDAIFQDRTFQKRLFGLGNGILVIESKSSGKLNTIRMRIPMTKLKRVHLPYPPTTEQAAIVRFLDWTNGRLERAIRAKRKVIALLNEQKQAIIHRAVTRGLDASVALKPSGISWLGDIPQHWEVISLRMRYSVDLGKMLDAKRITGRYSVPYLRNRDVQWDRIVTDDLPVMDIPPREIARYTVKRGDLLVCEGGKVGRSAFWDEQLPVCGFQKALHRVRCHDGSRDYSRFFFYQMQLAAGRGVFSADGNENTIAHLTCEKLRRHRFAFPPFAEQMAVADSLDGEFRQFQIAISRLEREIELLREYRTRLVADVVTGKLDVREAAARLPEEDAPDPVEDNDVSDEIEPADEEAAA